MSELPPKMSSSCCGRFFADFFYIHMWIFVKMICASATWTVRQQWLREIQPEMKTMSMEMEAMEAMVGPRHVRCRWWWCCGWCSCCSCWFFLAPKSACSTRYYCIIKQIEQWVDLNTNLMVSLMAHCVGSLNWAQKGIIDAIYG